MKLIEILQAATAGQIAGGCAVTLGIIFTLVQVSPIKANPWSWIARKLGRAINKEVFDKVDAIDAKVETLRNEMTEKAILDCRIRILRFGDSVRIDAKHSKEHFDQILRDIDAYEVYCATHERFRNNVTGMTVELIKEAYRHRCEHNDFL